MTGLTITLEAADVDLAKLANQTFMELIASEDCRSDPAEMDKLEEQWALLKTQLAFAYIAKVLKAEEALQ